MASQKPLTDDEGEVRELTGRDFEQAVPFSALPTELQSLLASPAQAVPEAKAEETSQPAA